MEVKNNNLGRLTILMTRDGRTSESETDLTQVEISSAFICIFKNELGRDSAFQLTRFLSSGTGWKKAIPKS